MKKNCKKKYNMGGPLDPPSKKTHQQIMATIQDLSAKGTSYDGIIGGIDALLQLKDLQQEIENVSPIPSTPMPVKQQPTSTIEPDGIRYFDLGGMLPSIAGTAMSALIPVPGLNVAAGGITSAILQKALEKPKENLAPATLNPNPYGTFNNGGPLDPNNQNGITLPEVTVTAKRDTDVAPLPSPFQKFDPRDQNIDHAWYNLKQEDQGSILPEATVGVNTGINRLHPDYKESFAENTTELIDPTGGLSWDDVVRAWRDGTFTADDILEPLGAIPLIGPRSKPFTKAGIEALKRMAKAKKAQHVLNVTDYIDDVKKDNFKHGGKLKGHLGLSEYEGNSHLNGGINITPNGVPTATSNQEVEGEETVYTMEDGSKYIFSKSLTI